MNIEKLREQFQEYLKNNSFTGNPQSLYDPINYIMSSDGKRIRPIMCLLMSCADNEHELKEDALTCALVIELFHNFTLVHDDIMDDADLRRGNASVHLKFNTPKAILSGDAMLLLCFKMLSEIQHENKELIEKQFLTTALDVCRGQEFDMEFESQDTVTYDDYIEMVRLKTGVLLGTAFYIGSILGNMTERESDKLQVAGEQIGIAFQIQDDYLDTYGNSDNTGKKQGGDILNGKKTLLYYYAIEKANEEDQSLLNKIYSSHTTRDLKDIEEVKRIFDKYDVKSHLTNEIEKYKNLTEETLSSINLNPNIAAELNRFLPMLTVRSS